LVEELNGVKEQFIKQVTDRRPEAHKFKQRVEPGLENGKRFQKIAFLNINRRVKQEVNNHDKLITLPKQAEHEQSAHEPVNVRHKNRVIKKGGGA
jgi:hypothetical protein